MMLHLKRWLSPPIFPDDEDQTRRASTLNIALIITLALVAIILVGGLLGGRTPPVIIVADVAIIIICLILRHWMHQSRIRLASAALIGVAMVCTTVLVALLGTIRVPTTAFYLLIVVVGGLLFDVSGIVVTTVVSSLAILGLIVAENAGLLPRPDYTVTITQWITYTALSGFSGSLTFVALQSTRRALQRADQEIAERRHAEEALREGEARYRRLVERLPDIVYVFSDRRGGLYYSASTESTLGYSLAHLYAHPFLWNESIHADDRAHVTRALQEFAASGAFDIEYRVRDAGGKWHWLRDRSIGRRIENGESFIEGLATDITDRKQMEVALRQANSTLQALIDHSPLAIIMLNPAGDVMLWNRAAETLYGWTAQEALGKPLLTVPAEKREEFQALRMRVNQGELISYMEVGRKRKDGSDVFLGLAIAPLKDAAGNVYAQMSIAADITERKRAEAALHALNAELEQRVTERTRELTDANVRLTELDRLKDEFIARISHELRTPLTNIKIYLELLEHGKPEKREQYMQTLHTETGKLYQQIDDLLEVSDLQAIRIEPQLIPLDINRLVQGLLDDQLPSAQAHGLSLTIAAAVKQPNVTSDWALVWQVLSRLMANALAYTPRGGVVTLRTDRRMTDDQAWLTIEVRDTGPGISEKDLPYIFEPFYRGAAASDYKTPGTGVGLSIAQRIMQQLGGRITVDSQPGHGSTFTIWLRTE